MTTRNHLRAVETEAEPPIDIYAKDKALIASINWSEVHCRGDRSRPVDLPDRPRRSGLERRR